MEYCTSQGGNQDSIVGSLFSMTGVLQLHASIGEWFNFRQKQMKPCAQRTCFPGPQI
jgi:hypothetical protein